MSKKTSPAMNSLNGPVCAHGWPLAGATSAGVKYTNSSTKDTNPKDAVGVRKVPFLSVLPLRVIGELALAMLEGARKYGRHNYRTTGVRASVYIDAVGRHLAAFTEGEDMDAESGVSHITKAIASLVVLRDGMMQGHWVDDRPPAAEKIWLTAQNAMAAEIIDKYPDAKPAHTRIT